MQPSIDWYFTVVFFIGILGLIVAAILYFVNKNESFSARILSGFLFCVALVSLSSLAFYTNFFLHYPHLARIVVFPSLCVAPLSYLYVRTVLEQQFRLRPRDALFFIPAVLYTLSMAPFYLMPAAQKLEIISLNIADKTLIAREPEGMLPQGWGIIFRLVYSLVLTAAQYVMLFRWRKKIVQATAQVPQNIEIIKWLFFFTLIFSSSLFLLLIEYAFQVSRFFELFRLITLTMSGIVLFNSAYLLVRPNILYGLTGWLQQADSKGTVNQLATAETSRLTLTIDQEKTFKTSLENHFSDKLPFLRPRYKIMELSEELNIPTYLLSAFINQKYGKNFSELVNDYRVDYLASLLRDNPGHYQYTLDALCKMAGFNSRTTFIAAVKKKTGRTPSEFYGLILQDEKP